MKEATITEEQAVRSRWLSGDADTWEACPHYQSNSEKWYCNRCSGKKTCPHGKREHNPCNFCTRCKHGTTPMSDCQECAERELHRIEHRLRTEIGTTTIKNAHGTLANVQVRFSGSWLGDNAEVDAAIKAAAEEVITCEARRLAATGPNPSPAKEAKETKAEDAKEANDPPAAAADATAMPVDHDENDEINSEGM